MYIYKCSQMKILWYFFFLGKAVDIELKNKSGTLSRLGLGSYTLVLSN